MRLKLRFGVGCVDHRILVLVLMLIGFLNAFVLIGCKDETAGGDFDAFVDDGNIQDAKIDGDVSGDGGVSGDGEIVDSGADGGSGLEKCPGEAWEPVAEGGFWSISLAVDSSGVPTIAFLYTDSVAPGLYLARKSLDSWVLEEVDTEGGAGWHPSIALDEEDNVHISYYEETESVLKYAHDKNGEWTKETVDASGYTGLHSSLVVDPEGSVHISYVENLDADYSSLRYAIKDSEGWAMHPLEFIARRHTNTSLCLDAEGRAHISFNGGVDGVSYVNNIVGDWTEYPVILDYGYADRGNALAVNHEGVGYLAFGLSGLMVGEFAEEMWTNTVVDEVPGTGKLPSMVMDGNGALHIGYMYASGAFREMRYATDMNGDWMNCLVDDDGFVGDYSSIAVGEDGVIHTAYYDVTGNQIRYKRIEF